ncbi:MAG TPA: hypothetical protein VGA56_01445 [Opitutaceae bacterium]
MNYEARPHRDSPRRREETLVFTDDQGRIERNRLSQIESINPRKRYRPRDGARAWRDAARPVIEIIPGGEGGYTRRELAAANDQSTFTSNGEAGKPSLL